MREHDDLDAGLTGRHLDRLTGAILDGRYRIDEKLAAGGFGSIYRAMDLVMGREVALKVLHRELARDASVVERFRREASALARLRDPHTVTMYDVGESRDGTRYIVMELLRGESLFEQFHAHDKRLPWRRVAAIARGVCSSLREAHALGIVHRDLKPANIHLEQHALESDYVKVLDFGIAKLLDASDLDGADITMAGQMIGTFDYMSPEQMIGGGCTGRSDVFALGIVMYEMIAGERPYGSAKGPATMLMTMLGATPVSLRERADVPPALDRVVMRAIERDPEDRLDVAELDAELARILEADAIADAEARFCDDDGPTWVEPATIPARTSQPRAPSPGRPSATMLGITPARGVAIVPRKPAPPAQPEDFAVGSRTQLPPLPVTPPPPPPVLPVVRFAPPPTPSRMAAGTAPIANKPILAPGYELERARHRDALVRSIVYALLVAAVVTAMWLLR